MMDTGDSIDACLQLYAMPVFDMLETVLVKKLHLPPSAVLRIVTRCTYVLLTAFVACTLPFFSDLLGFLGGFAFAPTTYFLPCIIWLILKKPPMFSLSWCINWILIFLGSLLAAVATIGGMRQIIQDASNYQFYQ
jgi:amino acid permease